MNKNLVFHGCNEVISDASDYLKCHGVLNPQRDAEELLGFVLNKERWELYMPHDNELSDDKLNKFHALVKRRSENEPLQYILNNQEFFNLTFLVDERVLIPRPETELLVEHILNKCFSMNKNSLTVLDIGTGSGNISVSLAKSLNCKVFATDVSYDALNVAITNAKFHNIDSNINFLQGDLFEPLNDLNEKFDIIASNPPYVSLQDYNLLMKEVYDWEPAVSLVGGVKGTEIIEKIIKGSIKYLKNRGWLGVEIGINQSQYVRSVIETTGEFGSIEIYKDYSGIDRVVLAQKR